MENKTSYRALQADIKKDLIKRFSEAEYTIENPLIVVDPFNLSPLTALVMFRTATPSRAVVVIKGKDCFTTYTQEFDGFKKVHQLPVHGLYAGCENTVEVRVISDAGKMQTNTLKITTKPLPDDMQKMKINSAVKDKMAPGITYTVGNGNHPVYRIPLRDVANMQKTYTAAFDANGDIRWFISDQNIGGIGSFTKLRNGNIAIGSEKNTGVVYFKHSCYELTHLGEIIHEYFAENLHHHIEEMPNGNLILFACKPDSATEEDFLVEVDREKETQIRTWDLTEIYPVTQASANYGSTDDGSPDTLDWLHGNCVTYVAADNCFIVSGRNQDLLFKFDIETNEIKWILTQPGDDIPESYRSKLLKPKDGNHTYHHGQHYPILTPYNGLLIFNNMSFADKFRGDTEKEQAEKFSHILQYRIDEDKMTFEVLWRSDYEIGRSSWSPVMGSADYLGQGHYYAAYASMCYDINGVHQREYFVGGVQRKPNFIFLNAPIQTSRFVEYLNDKVVFDAQYDGNFGQTYRTHRWGLYWSNSEADIGLK